MIDAVIFDLDGVLVDSEQVWDEVREDYTRERGGVYSASAARDMMGMSAPEWSRYMVESLGVPGLPEHVVADVLARMLERYGEEPPLLPGAVEVSPETQALIDSEVRRVVEDAHRDVTTLLTDNRGKLDVLARSLLQHETLDERQAYAAAGVTPVGGPRIEAARRLLRDVKAFRAEAETTSDASGDGNAPATAGR